MGGILLSQLAGKQRFGRLKPISVALGKHAIEFCSLIFVYFHVKWVPCHHGMARPQVADGGEGLQIWRVAANILNKQSRTAERRESSRLGVGRGAKNPPP
jgi:hypothetical protein